jgi:hypothetical protein
MAPSDHDGGFAYQDCSRRYVGRKRAAARKQHCAWGQLVDVRQADLFGFPFFAFAIGLFLILVYAVDGSRADAADSPAE